MPRKLHLDFETYSSADIRKVGLENYVSSPDFTVTVIAWAFDDGPVQFQSWPRTEALPDAVLQHILRGGEIRAHNAAFEYAVLSQYGLTPKPEQMVCTMQKALAYGLPSGPAGGGEGSRAGNHQGRDETPADAVYGPSKGQGGAPWHESDPGRLADLAAYCEDDVRAERAVDAAIPDLHPFERRLSLLDGEINRKGVLLDTEAVAGLRSAAQRALGAINAECASLTSGAVTAPGSQVARLMAWLAENGCPLPDVSRETVSKALERRPADNTPRCATGAGTRQEAAKSSVAKLERMLDVASTGDGRARQPVAVLRRGTDRAMGGAAGAAAEFATGAGRA